jgi:acyl-CoA thioesterase FadM
MPRIKIDLPAQFPFTVAIPVRITDLNYGGHVGNDTILSIIHEARVLFLRYFGYDELNLAGAGLIMSDVAIEFKNELFYGDKLSVSVSAGEFSKIGFDVFYKLKKVEGNAEKTIALAKTGMICYDYANKKMVPVPAEVIEKLSPH